MTRIQEVMLDCLANDGDEGAILVELDSLMNLKGWFYEDRLKANFERIVEHVRLLPKPFLDPEGGWTFINLPFYANESGLPGKQWGGQRDGGLLLLICSYYGICQDPLHTLGFKAKSLSDIPGGASYFSFNIEDEFLNMVRDGLGLRR
jgi:hypothetical protein